jgi:hypothetical protein
MDYWQVGKVPVHPTLEAGAQAEAAKVAHVKFEPFH